MVFKDLFKKKQNENETYRRFSKLNDWIGNSTFFDTKLGKRQINTHKFTDGNKLITFIYRDFDGSVLFNLFVYPNGSIECFKSKIDDVAIFSAIYELETILYKDKQEKNKKDMLNFLFRTSCAVYR